MLHPVGKLPATVYWRRRLMVLVLLLAVLGGAGWLAVTLLLGPSADAAATSAASTGSPVRVPALERVVPTVSSVSTPTPPEVLVAETETVPPAPPAPAPGDPCTDEMVSVEVRTPPSAAVGSKPTFELLVTNISAVPCVRTLDKGVQELVLLDQAGTRIWGSNDCFPEVSADNRTLAPGEVVTFPVLWGGLTSEPTCTAPRANPAPGSYLVRGRLDTKVSAVAPFVLS